jgi:hypothetical protein
MVSTSVSNYHAVGGLLPHTNQILNSHFYSTITHGTRRNNYRGSLPHLPPDCCQSTAEEIGTLLHSRSPRSSNLSVGDRTFRELDDVRRRSTAAGHLTRAIVATNRNGYPRGPIPQRAAVSASVAAAAAAVNDVDNPKQR